jgi:formylmethanofuran dehydrogenase subunit E
MSDQGFSEGVLYGGFPEGDLTGRPDLTGAAVLGPVTIGNCQISASNIDWGKHADFVFHGGGKEVLRITAKGELIFADATEAAMALKEAWERLR